MKQHSSRFLHLVNESKQHIKEITADKLKSMMDHHEPINLIDVRETEEWEAGHIGNAQHLSKGLIERDIEKYITDAHAPIVVYCSGGFRSVLVAESLQCMGYTHVASLSGGLQGWLNAGYAIEY